MGDLWLRFSTTQQDIVVLIALLLPAAIMGVTTLRGYAPGAMLRGLLRRYWGISLTFTLLIALSVALGTALLAQERGLREGTAQAAEKFNLIVAAPGDEVTTMLAAVYLQATDMPLVDGPTYNAIATHEYVALAAPIAFGDSYQGAPVVGTTEDFVTHLSEGLSEGRMFEEREEAVAGARIDLAMGDSFSPAHGLGDAAVEGAHGDLEYTVVGRMPMTGSPWDRAILVPVESVWEVHGMADGHALDRELGDIGPPYDPDRFPGTPAVLVQAEALWANYSLRSEFTTERTMAFFPGAVLTRLYRIMGDIRAIMSLMAVVTQILVGAGVLAGLVILTRLLSRRLALFRALGAPRRFIFALTWSFAAILVTTGSILGLLLGLAASGAISRAITARTDVLVEAQLGWSELHLVAGFVSLTVILALLPAWLSMRRPVVVDLRG